MAQLAQLVASWDVGGRAQLVSSFAPATPGTPTFTSPADRGTLDIAACSYSANVFTFKCRWDNSQNSQGARFLYAQVNGVLGLTPVFRVERSNLGLTISSASRFVYSYDGVNWLEFANRSSDATYYIFSHSAPFDGNAPYVAVWYPWPTGRTVPWIQSMVGTGYVSDTTSSTSFVFETRSATVNEVGAVITATPLYAFKISSGSGNAPDGSPKRNIVLIGGTHASEDVGNYALKGAVELLVSEDDQAKTLRQWFNVFVYPVVASAGRKGGGTRGDFQSGYMTSDVNRQWDSSIFETLVKHKAAILADTGGAAAVFIDFHGAHTHASSYDQYEAGNDVAAWRTAIETYVGPGFRIDLSDKSGYSSAWAQSALSPEFSLISEFGYVAAHITQTQQETAGAHRMRAVALLASQDYFGETLAVEGDMAAVETALDTCAIVGEGTFNISGALNAIESGLDICVMTGSIARMAFVGAIPTISGAQDIPLSFDTSGFFVGLPLERTFTMATGTLPAGVTLNPASGVISGTPASAGLTTGLSVRCTDSAGNPATSNVFTIDVAEELEPVMMTLVWLP